MLTGGDGVRNGGSVKRFVYRSVVRHCTGFHRAVRHDKYLSGQYIGCSCGHAGNVLIGFGDSRNSNAGQTIIAAVGDNILLCFCRGSRLSLQRVVSSAPYTRYSAGTVVPALGDGIGIALFDRYAHRATVDHPRNDGGQRVQFCAVLGKAKLYQLCPDGVS